MSYEYNKEISNAVRYYNAKNATLIEKSIFLDADNTVPVNVKTVAQSLVTPYQKGRAIPNLASSFENVFESVRKNLSKELPLYENDELNETQKTYIENFRNIINKYTTGSNLDYLEEEVLMVAAITAIGGSKNYVSKEWDWDIFGLVCLPSSDKYKQEVEKKEEPNNNTFLVYMRYLQEDLLRELKNADLKIRRESSDITDDLIIEGIFVLQHMFKRDGYIDTLIESKQFVELSMTLHLLEGFKNVISVITQAINEKKGYTDPEHILIKESAENLLEKVKLVEIKSELPDIWLNIIILNRLISGVFNPNTVHPEIDLF